MKTFTTFCFAFTALLSSIATLASGNPYGYSPYQYPTTANSPHGNYQQAVPTYQQPIPTHPTGTPINYAPTAVYQPAPVQAAPGYGQPFGGQPAYGQSIPQSAPIYAPVTRAPESIPVPQAAPQAVPLTAPQTAPRPNTSYYDSYSSPTPRGHAPGLVNGSIPSGGNITGHAGTGYGAGAGCSGPGYGAGAYGAGVNNGAGAYGPGAYDAGAYGPGAYGAGAYGAGACGVDGYGSAGYGRRAGALRRGWYGSFGGLVMTRDDPNGVVLTSDVNWPELALMSTTSPDIGWEGGFEITFGRHLTDCIRWEVGFWNVNQFKGTSEVWSPAQELLTPINLTNIALGPDDLDEFYDNSSSHAALRKNNFYNLELNFYYRLCAQSACGGCRGCGHGRRGGGCGAGGCGAGGYGADGYSAGAYGAGGYGVGYGAQSASDYYATAGGAACFVAPQRWNIELLAGVRYFNFDEHIIFAGLEGGAVWGELGGTRQAYMVTDVENQLLGAQIGALVEYNLTPRWSLYAKPKIGFYNNHSEHLFNVARGNDADFGLNVGTGEPFPVRGSNDSFSVLAELDLGARWNFGCHWSAYAGYRLVAISGIALADNQIPSYIADQNGIRNIDTNGDLILHGFNFGLGFQY